MPETERPAPGPPTAVRGEEWERRNAEFLSASLDWLRILLRRYAEDRTGARDEAGPEDPTEPECGPRDRAGEPTPPAEPRASLPWGRRRQTPHAPSGEASGSGPDTPARTGARVATGPAGGDELAAAAARVAAAEAAVPAPALVVLAQRLGLSRFERDVLLMCLAEEIAPAMGGLFAAAHGSQALAHPTLGLALAALPDPSWEAASAHGALRFWRLVEISRPAGAALVTSPVRADERIVDYVRGLDYLDERLSALVTRLPAAPSALPASQQRAVARCTTAWERSPAAPPVVRLTGGRPGSKQVVAACAAAEFGLTLYRLPAPALPAHPDELDRLVRLWDREAALLPLALYLDADDDTHDAPVADDTTAASLVGRFLSRSRIPAFLGSRDAHPRLARPAVDVEVTPPTFHERAEAWREALGADADAVHIGLLAGQFAMDVAAIDEVARSSEPGRVWDACVARGRSRLDGLAQRLRPDVGWDDIVLPDQTHTLLRQIAAQVSRQETVYETWGFAGRLTRGLGVTALFAGPSGTGKTMAAEVLAHELGLDLYRADLSGVMSKYIGETEKNLRRLFDAAEAGGAVLFLDEADALLARRSEVKDAHDRYANVQTDYLLQRMESYRGLAIMATNMRQALDAAFVRRLRFVVDFPFPDAGHRRELWRRAFPEHAPGRAALDYDRLAQLDVSGAMTRNIAVNAAFLAASGGTPITMPHVLQAAREEFRKLQHPVRERDFAWPYPQNPLKEALS
ncbi:ATP-binding protein [Streptomyces sp. R44]|uniref:ATP-binding protein n=1 Tax=Streptomyces sp. R44 TaxID=3238633 RepID=A0AB39T7Y7_9ACTN